MGDMNPVQTGRIVGAAVVTAFALIGAPAPLAAAAPCPDVEMVFARGTFEAPGVGGIGQSFVDAVRSKATGKSVSVYPVTYPGFSQGASPTTRSAPARATGPITPSTTRTA